MFELFWHNYPRKQAKKDALKAWTQVAPSPTLLERILEALAWQRETRDWQKDDGHYVPLPATYLRGERWTDEPPRTVVAARGQAPAHAWTCGHQPRCINRWTCERRVQIDALKQEAVG